MKPSELDHLLKSAPPPEPSGPYWDEFPKRVMAKVHWQTHEPGSSRRQPDLRRRVPAWALGLAAACVVIAAFGIGFWRGRESGPDDRQLAAARKYYQEVEALFPNQVRAIAFGRQGPSLTLADRADVPPSTPFYLKICGPKGCQEFITFSGQQIQIDGEKCEVLADGRGRIIIVGKDAVWSAETSSKAVRVEAKPLGTAM
jgi:hypothetical protein